MLYLNRSALVVKPKQPFVDWANSTDPGGTQYTLQNLKSENNVYLVSEIDDKHDLEREIKTYHRIMFENELIGWATDRTTWPKMISLELFHEWFVIEHNSMVADLSNGPIELEEF
ncbi:MAG: hypothetical protein MRK02_09025 [Candidatus Scalindua sp.]|nr:hypothetical protein [Candidatus Scalindua sp.]